LHPDEREPYKPRTLASRGRTRVHFLRDMVRGGSVKLIKCAGTQNVADALTKSLPRPAFDEHREFLKGTVQSFCSFFASAHEPVTPTRQLFAKKGNTLPHIMAESWGPRLEPLWHPRVLRERIPGWSLLGTIPELALVLSLSLSLSLSLRVSFWSPGVCTPQVCFCDYDPN